MNTNPSIDILGRYYRESAAMTGADDPRQANEAHNRMHEYYKLLREEHEGQEQIAKYMNDDNPHVRTWAAAHCLQWWPTAARAVLEELRSGGGISAVTAAMTLREFEQGSLSFDY